jgi:hypothetical protein
MEAVLDAQRFQSRLRPDGRPKLAGDPQRGADAEVEQGPNEDRGDTAEAIEEDFGNARAKERDSDRQSADQHGGCAESRPELDSAGAEPAANRGDLTARQSHYRIGIG